MIRRPSGNARPTLQTLRDQPDRGCRQRTMEAHGLLLRALRRGEREGGTFLLRRARRDVSGLQDRAAARLLERVLDAFGRGDADSHARTDALLTWAGSLEGSRRLTEAEQVLALARELDPENAELALHGGRVARLSGESEMARKLYRRARKLDGERTRLSRMAHIGMALLSTRAERELGRALEGALAAGDLEAAAVAHEARAEVRRRSGGRRAPGLPLRRSPLR